MRTKFDRYAAEHTRREFFVGLQHRVRMFDVARTVTDCPDPKDNKFLELAETSGAELIIASDPHLTEMHPWREIPIMPPAGLSGRRTVSARTNRRARAVVLPQENGLPIAQDHPVRSRA